MIASDAKIITVFGATGAQGNAVVQSLLANKTDNFKIRGTTRNPSSEKGQALAKAGVEVVQADAWNKDEVRAAFRGSWGVFVNTNSDDPELAKRDESESDQGKDLVDAALDVGVKHFVYSALAIHEPVEQDCIDPPTFKEKHKILKYLCESRKFETVTAVYPGWYNENFITPALSKLFGDWPNKADKDGVYVYKVPNWGKTEDKPVPWIAMDDDFGDIVHGVFLAPEKYHSKIVQAHSEDLNHAEAVKAFERATGKKARLEIVPSWEEFETFDEPAGIETKKIIRATQLADGQQFGAPLDLTDSGALKKAAAEAKGESKTTLTSLEIWFSKHFA